MRRSIVRRVALLVVFVATLALVPAAVESPAVAFEWFDECPQAFPCDGYFPLYTAGVCNDGTQTLLIRRTQWGAFCYETF